MISSSVSSTSSGVKRGFANLLTNFQAATPEVEALFEMVGEVDFEAVSTNPGTRISSMYSELVDVGELLTRKCCFLVPSVKPLLGQCDLEFIASAPSVVCCIEADPSVTGGGLLVRIIGDYLPAAGKTALDDLKEICLSKVPKKFWVAKPSVSPMPTVFEEEIKAVVSSAGCKKARILPFAPTGNSSAGALGREDGGIVRKAARVEVVDMNQEIRIVINKEEAQKRVTMLGGLLREMHPDRFARFCRDYSYDVATFREEARRQKENKGLKDADPCYSIVRMQHVQDLEVWSNPEVFSVWILGHWKTDDWTYSLRNFAAPRCTGWDQNTDYQGRKNLKIALENWIDFQRIFKGEEFHGALNELFKLWDAPGDPMSRHDNCQIQYHLEDMIRGYFYELCRTHGTSCCMVEGQPLHGQAESVALLKVLANNLAVLISSREMEASPAPMFYQTSNHYASIQNKFSKPGRGGDTVTPVTGRGRDPNWIDTKPLCHMEGLCFWHLAGKVGLVNAKNKPFVCRETGFTHADLKQVPIAKVRKLVTEEAFMGVTMSEDLKGKLRQAVEGKRNLFKK